MLLLKKLELWPFIFILYQTVAFTFISYLSGFLRLWLEGTFVPLYTKKRLLLVLYYYTSKSIIIHKEEMGVTDESNRSINI